MSTRRGKAGEQLPSVRRMAEDLVINPNTVVRAYRDLETEGLVELRHGAAGSPSRDLPTVTATPPQKENSTSHRLAMQLWAFLGRSGVWNRRPRHDRGDAPDMAVHGEPVVEPPVRPAHAVLGSLTSIAVIMIACMVFDASRLPGWLLDDPARLAPIVWSAAVGVIAKYLMAAYA